jgi:hypothetical protein
MFLLIRHTLHAEGHTELAGRKEFCLFSSCNDCGFRDTVWPREHNNIPSHHDNCRSKAIPLANGIAQSGSFQRCARRFKPFSTNPQISSAKLSSSLSCRIRKRI